MATTKRCPACGGTMFFDPGWDRLVCQYCGTKSEIAELKEEAAQEISISSVKALASHDWGVETRKIKCAQCGAVTVNDALQLAGCCPFCGSATVAPAEDDGDQIAPNAVIPFIVSEQHAEMFARRWIGGGKYQFNEFHGVYVPYWTFDVNTSVSYSARFGYRYGRGDDAYYKYYNKSGEFKKFFDDFPVSGSSRTVTKYNTGVAKPYTPEALAGFVAEHYSVGLEEAWQKGKQGIMKSIEDEIRNRESADVVNNLKYDYLFEDIKFKYVLVPVWISSFVQNGRVYNFYVNGQTGEVSGNKRKPFPKIFIIILIILGVIITHAFLRGIIVALIR